MIAALLFQRHFGCGIEKHETNADLHAAAAGGGLRKKRRGVALLPAMFTLGNCLCGFASINYASRGIIDNLDPKGYPDFSNYAVAGYFIFAAMLFDMFDGFVARLTKSASDFGAELDSLADMVSFGLAPGFLSIHLIGGLLNKSNFPAGMKALDIPGPFSNDAWGRLFWVVAAIYVSCTALRLARFNVLNKHEVSSHMNFRGMPSPGAAAVVASTIIFFATLYARDHVLPFNVSPAVKECLRTVFPYLLPVVLLVAALLMVSRFAYSHLVWEPQTTVVVAIYLYGLSAPVGWLWRVCLRRRGPALQ